MTEDRKFRPTIPASQRQQLYSAILSLIGVLLGIVLTIAGQAASHYLVTEPTAPEPIVAPIYDDEADPIETLGTTHFTDLDIEDLTADSLDLDGALDVDTSGSIDFTTTEASADAIFLDANGTVTTGIDIDLGSVSGMAIDGGLVNIGGATFAVADGDNDLGVTGVLEVDGELELDGALDADSTSNFAGMATFAAGITGAQDVESVLFPTVVSTNIAFGTTSGAIATIGDGEVWFVHDVFVNVTADFDTGANNDAALTIGDGNDTDGFVVLADAELQAADTEATGFTAGWQGLIAATQGAYIDEAAGANTFIYAPSGADETIDYAITGTDLAAGTATVYVIYTRIQ